ncbi:hypothetical protein FAM18175_02830 [Lacticaseibacillus paracasei]|nr:hypothetical protein FAM18175_02830 [Lacticaseibacillus paracasei]
MTNISKIFISIGILSIYFCLLANMVIGFLPNYVAIFLALLILVPLITKKIMSNGGTRKG